MKRELEIYIHIPFCAKKCDYCDFLSFPASEEIRERYVDALVKDIRRPDGCIPDLGEAREAAGREKSVVRTIFLGGGTPSLLRERQMERILDAVRQAFDVDEEAEITMEANPGTLDAGKLQACREMGINRLSMGLQSVSDGELKMLGRIHTYRDFLENYEEARRAGFDNINIDLMSALPGQTAKSWREGLEQAAALEPEHISAYSLMIEEHTPFYKRYGQDRLLLERGETPQYLPDEEEERQMYAITRECLAQAGYHRYEISNYAKEGRECWHNEGYWKRTNYLGFGLGASSLLGSCRFRQTEKLKAYLQTGGQPEEVTILSREDEMAETMFLGLRRMEGVSEGEFAGRFCVSMEEVYREPLGEMLQAGLLKKENGYIRLTGKGIDVSNYVMAQFLL